MSPFAQYVQVCPLLVIGGGAMASAILAGAAEAGLLDGPCVVAEPDAAKRTAIDALWPSINSVGAVAAAFEAMPYGEASVLLAVKPQMLPRVAEEIETAAGDSMLEGSCILSILAGVTTQKLGETLKGRVVRAMPNLPAKVGMGATALAAGDTATAEDVHRAHKLFRSVGQVYDLPESAINAFTGIAGSGPAYAFLLAEAMAVGGLEAGKESRLSEAAIRAIVAQTLRGAAEMLLPESEGTPPDPAELRAAVTSKGGTTAAALDVLEQHGVRDAVRKAVLAAARRAGELGG